MRSKSVRVLVTGGAGFVGSHLVERLLAKDLEVTVIDDFSTGQPENLRTCIEKADCRLIKGDIRDSRTIREALKDIDVIFHEAALVNIQQSVNVPSLANEINVNGTLNLLEASLKCSVRRFVFASSAAVYGEQQKLPIKEGAALHPISPYAASKIAAESYLKAFNKTYGLETVCLRYFNIYGPRQAGGTYAGAITEFMKNLRRNRQPTIYGDGEQTRDFINVKDVVEANVLAMERNCSYEVFNVGTGTPITINELLKTLQTIFGKAHIKPKYAPARQFDIRNSYADISKIISILGFKPTVPLAQGLQWLAKPQGQAV